jgi:hypothetical protein
VWERIDVVKTVKAVTVTLKRWSGFSYSYKVLINPKLSDLSEYSGVIITAYLDLPPTVEVV